MDSPLHEDSADVAIIGAGFSGTIAAIHLLKQTDDQITVALVERTSEFGRGLAYRTRDRAHRLNVPAAKMGAFPDDIEGFHRGCKPDPSGCEPRACTHFIQTHLCPRTLSENISSTCLRR
jgi:uncharacterized NAD(P)/FAD-binding protein YdhS